MKETRVKIVGATGYGGAGITELLLRHPAARIGSLVDLQHVGERMGQVYPHLAGFCDLPILSPDDPQAMEPHDVVFLSTPDGVGMQVARKELEKGARVIDYSGDFRFNQAAAYAAYAERIGREPAHQAVDLLGEAVYGLPELHRDLLTEQTRLVGNPGCFAVSCILGLAPAVRAGVLDLESLICDCKTGVSGAGKTPAPAFHYPARYDQMNAYKLAGHQHVREIERELGLLADAETRVTFTGQVVPVCRGIMSCLYGTLRGADRAEDIRELYRTFYSDSLFVRVYDETASVGSAHVRGTNYCNLVVTVDERTRRLRVVSYIDNLVKGQAGNALQNMNLLCGYPEDAGLDLPGQYP